MKKITMIVAVVAVVMFFVSSSMAASLYGFTANGTYFLAKSLVDKVEGEPPALMCDQNNWKPQKAVLVKGFYIVKLKLRRNFSPNFKKSFCWQAGHTSFFYPHEFEKAQIEEVVMVDLIDNEQGGYNFRMLPSQLPDALK